jgi:hypothetical protein
MNSRSLVSEWFEIGGTELRTAKYLFDTMYPKPTM